jgi:uncharacterized protein DUF5753
MYEQPQQLAQTAGRPNVTLQIPRLDRPHTAFGELSALFRFEPGTEATLENVMSIERLRNDFPLEGEKETHLRWIALPTLSSAPLGPDRSKQLALRTAGSHWSGGQREP